MAGLFLIVVALILYFLPSMVASSRRCKRAAGIVLLNLFLGWTILGWVGALIWAVSDTVEARPA